MGIYKDTTDFPIRYHVQINSCGSESNFKTEYTLLRPYGRSDYYILYVAEGYIEVILPQKRVRVGKGQCVLYFPKERQEIRYPSDCKLTAYFTHFTGEAIEETMQQLALEKISFFSVKDSTKFEVYFRLLIEDYLAARILQTKGVCQPKTSSLIFQLLSMLDPREELKKDDRITSLMVYISDHFKEDINLEKLAEQAYVSPSRFAHLFTEKTGVSPHKLILSLRIDEAKKLLVYSSTSINEICYDVGFSDPAYFSRIFKKLTGVSPSEYRKHKPL